MPSSPRIPKGKILEEALNIVIEEGYENLNIKTLAKKLNSSTQPISWHFNNMENFRKELCNYALNYANDLMEPKESDIDPFASVGKAYVDIAFDKPNLFKYLYLGGGSQYILGKTNDIKSDTGNDELARVFAEKYNMSKQDSEGYIMDIIIYTHGILSLVVSGVITSSKEEVLQKIKKVSDDLLIERRK